MLNQPCKILWFLLALFLLVQPLYAAEDLSRIQERLKDKPKNKQCVIVLHGITASPELTQPVADYLKNIGYQVNNNGYPTGDLLENIAPKIISQGLDDCARTQAEIVHIVAHSMGGLVLRQYLSKNSIDNLGFVVMLGTPNHGSYLMNLAPYLSSDYSKTYGKTGAQLRVEKNSFTSKLPRADNYYLGVIAGTGHSSLKDIFYAIFLKGKDDARVTVTSTKLQGMKDHLVTPYQHNEMLSENEVQQQILHFLEQGRFAP